jgi:uncharacterized sporulation protein YeaH/YhbH (DUF444 family)
VALDIETDINRFKHIVRGKIRKDLKKYMSQGEMIGRKGRHLVSIPLPQIEIPRFKFGSRNQGGIGQGEGQPGTPIGDDGEQQPGQGKAGEAPGEHLLEVDLTLEELAAIMGEELKLPRIKPKGQKQIETEKDRYVGISRTGPESLRHFKHTYRQALRRQISTGSYQPDNPIIIPIKEDKRYRSWRTKPKPQSNAVILYMMDVSGSMGETQKEIVRTTAFWLDTWLASQYKGLETRYIIHDAAAKEVDKDTFFRTKESGGTLISSAYKLCKQIIVNDYDVEAWNIYPFHFSDGDNWSGTDTRECLALLDQFFFPTCNVFCYGQVESEYGSGQFLRDLKEHYATHEQLLTAKIDDRDDIYNAIKTFLGKGK